jgi:hypothetical protein
MSQISSGVEVAEPPKSRRDQGVAGVPAAPLPAKVGPTVVVVAAIGDAYGSLGGAAALACAGAGDELASILIDVGGRLPRPTLLASSAARRLEEGLAVRLPEIRAAARGRCCHLSVGVDNAGLEAAAAAVSESCVDLAVLHLPPVLAGRAPQALEGIRITSVLLRADLRVARPLVAPVVRDLMDQGFRVGVLKQRLGWVAERRALFGALPPDAPDGLPPLLLSRLVGEKRHAGVPRCRLPLLSIVSRQAPAMRSGIARIWARRSRKHEPRSRPASQVALEVRRAERAFRSRRSRDGGRQR